VINIREIIRSKVDQLSGAAPLLHRVAGSVSEPCACGTKNRKSCWGLTSLHHMLRVLCVCVGVV
jgi:hypothetical protein